MTELVGSLSSGGGPPVPFMDGPFPLSLASSDGVLPGAAEDFLLEEFIEVKAWHTECH